MNPGDRNQRNFFRFDFLNQKRKEKQKLYADYRVQITEFKKEANARNKLQARNSESIDFTSGLNLR